MFSQFKRVLLLGMVCLLLAAALPPGVPIALADNAYGPQIAAWLASDAVGVPYRAGGSDPATGLDNVGLISYAYRQLGVNLPRTVSEQWNYGIAVNSSELEPGDLVFFRDASTARAVSVGIYLRDGGFAYASATSKSVVTHLLSESYFTRYYLGARRVFPADFPAFYQVIADKALSLQGLPYQLGSSEATGAGTAGLMQYIYSSFYLDVPGTLDALAKTGVFIARNNLRAGDMVFFKSITTGLPYRVGLYVGDQQFLVTSDGLGEAVLRSLDDDFYAVRYMGARRPYARFTEPISYTRPITPAVSLGDQLVESALQELGKPYLLGAEGPNAYDCSGLTQTVFARFGYKLPRVSSAQASVGVPVSFAELEPGDLLFFHDTWRNDGNIDHVAIYIGENKVVHAIGGGVTISSLNSYWVNHFSSARRLIVP